MNIVKFDDVNDRIIAVRGQRVIIDCDVAALYGVETRDVNKAVKNNPDKFPEGYVFALDRDEFADLRWKISTTNLTMSRVLPKAFTKKGCYMLATILKSPKATQATIAIIEAFEKMQDMSVAIAELMKDHENVEKQKTMVEKGEELFEEIIGSALDTVGTETSFELNLAAFKIKHTVKRSRKL
jgi:phage regulator Rha-like protein